MSILKTPTLEQIRAMAEISATNAGKSLIAWLQTSRDAMDATLRKAREGDPYAGGASQTATEVLEALIKAPDTLRVTARAQELNAAAKGFEPQG